MIQPIMKKLAPASIKNSLKASQTLSFEYGHFKTDQDWVYLVIINCLLNN